MKYSTKNNFGNVTQNSDDYSSSFKSRLKSLKGVGEVNNTDKNDSNNLSSDLLNRMEFISPIPQKKQKRKISEIIFTEELNEIYEEFNEKEDDFS